MKQLHFVCLYRLPFDFDVVPFLLPLPDADFEEELLLIPLGLAVFTAELVPRAPLLLPEFDLLLLLPPLEERPLLLPL